MNVKFHWSTSVKVISWLTSLLLIGTLAFLLYHNITTDFSSHGDIIGMVIVVLVFIYIAWNVPISLSVDNKQVTLKRFLGKDVTIPIADIKTIETIPDKYVKNSVRLFGSGGMFGYFGKFRSTQLGVFTLFATETTNLLMIITNQKTYVFSCTEREALIEEVEKMKGV